MEEKDVTTRKQMQMNTRTSSSSSSSCSCCRFSHLTSPSFSSCIAARVSVKNPIIIVAPLKRSQSSVISSATTSELVLRSKFRHYSNLDDSTSLGGDGYEADPDDYDEDSGAGSEEDVYIEIKKLESNSRRINSRIGIDAPLHTVWKILTDYERLTDFIPGLACCQLLLKSDNFARLFQIGQQNLGFGLKFNAKGTVDCYEKELKMQPFSRKRDIDFKMIEGDFQVFEGKWSIEEFDEGRLVQNGDDSSTVRETCTTLSYLVDVKPKLWLPVQLLEGRLCKEIRMNLISIREEAQKAIYCYLSLYYNSQVQRRMH